MGIDFNNLLIYWIVDYIVYGWIVFVFKIRVYFDCKKIRILVGNKKEMNKFLVDRRVFN